MTRPNATCEVWLDGQRVPCCAKHFPDAGGLPFACSPLSVTWGRSTSTEQPGASTAAFLIRDPRDPARRRPLLDLAHAGSTVEVWAAGEVPSPGSSSIVEDPGYEDTVPGAMPFGRVDVQAGAGKVVTVDVDEAPGDGRYARVRVDGTPAELADDAEDVEAPKFAPWRRITLHNRSLRVHAVTFDGETGDVYVLQNEPNGSIGSLLISRYKADGSWLGDASFPNGGVPANNRGETFRLTRINGRVHLTFRYGVTPNPGLWVRIPWGTRTTWTVKQALSYRVSEPARDPLARRDWWQGETSYRGRWFRLYGGPFNNDGPLIIDLPATVEFVEKSKTTKVVDAAMLGRAGMSSEGVPINGRLQPAGIMTAPVDGIPSLIVAVLVGSAGGYELQAYSYPLATIPEQPVPAPAVVSPGPVTVVVPPLPFVDPGDVPGQWDSVPQMNPGGSWPVSLRVRVPFGSQPVRMTGFAYSSPWAAARLDPALVTITGPTAPADGQWHTLEGTLTLSANVGAPAWVALGVTAELPSSLSWSQAAGTWNDHPEAWADYATVHLDDVTILAPNSAERRVLVFSGEVTSARAAPAGGREVDLTYSAVDVFGRLGNDRIGSAPWPVESATSRVERIAAAAHVDLDVIVDDTLDAVQLSRRDVDAQEVLGLLQDVADSAGAVAWAATHAVTGPYLFVEDPDLRRGLRELVKQADGVTVRNSETTGIVSAWDVLRDGVEWTQDVADVVTVVEVTWLEQALDDEQQPTTIERKVVVEDSPAVLATYGRRLLSISTELTTANAATILAEKLLARARNITWRADNYTFDTRSLEAVVPSVPDRSRVLALMDLLDGTARIGLGLTLSDLPEFVPSEQVASVYVEGGTYTYQDGYWSLALNITPAAGQGLGAKWEEIPADWTWQDFDPDVTWLDLYGATI